MSSIKILRSSTTSLVDGVSALPFGTLAVTNIAGVTKYYVGSSADVATEIAGDSFAKLNAAQTFTKAQANAFVDLTSGPTIAFDASLANNYNLTLDQNATLSNPTNALVGTRGLINVHQDFIAKWNLSYDWGFNFDIENAPLLINSISFDITQLEYSIDGYNTGPVTFSQTGPIVSLSWPNHRLPDGAKVRFTTTGTLPANVSPNTTYWVRPFGPNSISLANSFANFQDGISLDVGGANTGVHTATAMSISVRKKSKFNFIELVPDVNNRILSTLEKDLVLNFSIAVNSSLAVPENIEKGGRYTYIITSSSGAQLNFEGVGIFITNTGNLPVIQADGITVLEATSKDGLTLLLDTIKSGYNPPADLLSAAAPNSSWVSYYDNTITGGDSTNITSIDDFGSNNLASSKVGAGNILLTNKALNSMKGFNFGTVANNGVFNLGTPDASSFMSSGNMTVMAVFKVSTIDNVNRTLFGFNTTFANFYLGYNSSTGQIDAWVFSGGVFLLSGITTIAVDKPILVTLVKNGAGTSYLYVNGALLTSGSMTGTVVGTTLDCYLGKFNAGGLFPMIGSIGEFTVWTTALSDSTRIAIENQRKSIFGII